MTKEELKSICDFARKCGNEGPTEKAITLPMIAVWDRLCRSVFVLNQEIERLQKIEDAAKNWRGEYNLASASVYTAEQILNGKGPTP